MARQARLALAGLMHYVLLRGLPGGSVFAAPADRVLFLDSLREAAQGVVIHGWGLLSNEAHLLLRPTTGESLGRTVQALGRRFVAGYNRRHGRSGTLWDGRFRSAVVEPGDWSLALLRRVDSLDQRADGSSSAAGRALALPAGMVSDPPELWALGNTPFEREWAYRKLLGQPVPPSVEQAIAAALQGGRVIGSDAFVSELARRTSRRLVAARRGRPKGARTRRDSAPTAPAESGKP